MLKQKILVSVGRVHKYKHIEWECICVRFERWNVQCFHFSFAHSITITALCLFTVMRLNYLCTWTWQWPFTIDCQEMNSTCMFMRFEFLEFWKQMWYKYLKVSNVNYINKTAAELYASAHIYNFRSFRFPIHILTYVVTASKFTVYIPCREDEKYVNRNTLCGG